MAKQKTNKEPETDSELESAINKAGYDFVDHGDNTFSVVCRDRGGSTALESSEFSDALYEAYMLVK